MDRLRNALVDRLTAAGVLRDERVALALRSLPRHLFLPELEPDRAYRDEAVPTKWGPDGRPISSSSQPTVMALMLQQLDLSPGHRVLEIGAGTGYNAALLRFLVGPTGAVTTVDIDADLVEGARRNLDIAGVDGVTVVCADGAAGWPEGAPYDRIILTVAAGDLAPAWVDQLAVDGRLVLPLSLRGVDRSVAFVRAGDCLTSVSVIPCGFMPLRGQLAAPDSALTLGPGVQLDVAGDRPTDPAGLYAALGSPAELLFTGVRVSSADAFDGLSFWLALYEPASGQLFAFGAAAGRGLVPRLFSFAGMVGTVAVVGEKGLAALTRIDGGAGPDFEVAVRAYGSDAFEPAHRLARNVRGWHEAGRRGTAGLRILACPRTADLTGDAVIDTRYRRFRLDWP